MNFLNNKLHGLALCFAIAVPAAYLGKLFPIIGAPVFAIILGLLMAGIPRSDIFQGGITFTSKKILQYAIILLGFGTVSYTHLDVYKRQRKTSPQFFFHT